MVQKAIKRKRGGLFCSKACCSEFVKTNGAIVEQKKKERLIFSCKQCGTRVLKKQSEIKRQSNVFCSHHCSTRYQRGASFGPQKELTCKFCSIIKPVQEKIYQQFLTNQEFFCRQDCKINYYKNQRQEINKPSNHIELKRGSITNCPECRKEFIIKENKSTKHGKRYCSKSCRMRYFNINHHVHSKVNTSYPENYLFSLLQKEFPTLEILKNDRSFLDCGLEIDIFIPSSKLAIEINGPVHYRPIFGEECLIKVKQKDQLKAIELQNRRIRLITLDVSQLTKLHEQQKFIETEFRKIKELINRLLNQD